MSIEPSNHSCNLQAPNCLLNELAGSERDLDDDARCQHCKQSCQELEMLAGHVGQHLADKKKNATRQVQAMDRIADDLRKICEEPQDLLSEQLSQESQQEIGVEGLKSFGNYRLLREIGRGGMGVVYEAEQIALGRRVAVKVLVHSLIQNETAAKRFQREATTAGSLHHTNIVPVHEVGNENGTWFYAMQLIDGSSLDVVRDEIRKSRSQAIVSTDDAAKLETDETDNRPVIEKSAIANQASDIARIPMSPDRTNGAEINSGDRSTAASAEEHYRFVADIGRQAASALQHAHQRGVIHRDVKPSNLILDQDGVVWLADFGLAKYLDDGLTETAQTPGTMRYMAPERFKGQLAPASDVYSLGASLYELLTLESAFSASDQLSLLEKIKNHEPRAPIQIDRSIPFDLQTIVLKAMAKEPGRRYSSAQAMQDDLDCFLDGRPISARRVSSAERLWLWSRKHKALATSIAALTLLVLATTVGSVIAATHFRNQEIKQSQLAQEKAAESKEAKKQRDIAYQNAYFADMRQAHQDWENGQVRRMLTTLRSYVPLITQQDVRGWEWYYLLAQAHQDKATLMGHEGSVTQVRWSADGKRLFSISADGTMRVWDQDGKSLHKISIPDVQQFALNPDSSQFATVSGDSVLRIWETTTRKLIRTHKSEFSALKSVDWNTQGDKLALAGEHPEDKVMVIEAESFETIETLEGIKEQNSVSISPDGNSLCVTHRHGLVIKDFKRNLVNMIDGTINRELYFGLQPMCIDWHPDNRRFAFGTYGRGVRVMEFNKDSISSTSLHHFENLTSVDAVAFSADGAHLITGNRAQVVDVYDLESNEQIESFKGHLGAIESISLHSSGKSFASSAQDGAIKIWEFAHASTEKTAEPIKDGAGISADGRWAWQQNGDQVVISDISSGKLIADITIKKSEHESAGKLSAKFFSDVDRVIFWNQSLVWVWNTRSWNQENEFYSEGGRSPSGSVAGDFAVLSRRWGEVETYNVRSGETKTIKAHFATSAVALSPNGEMLVTATRGKVSLWDMQTKSELANLFGHRPNGFISVLTWGNSGRFFATGSIDQTIKIWDAHEKKLKQTLRGLQGTPRTHFFGFSNDDSRFMADDRGKIIIWEVNSGRELLSFPLRESRSIFEDFSMKSLQTGFGLPESALRFDSLRNAEAISENRLAIERFEHQTLHARAMFLLTRTRKEGGEPDRGLALASRALELNPTDPQYLLSYSLAAYRNEKYDEALRTLRLAIDSGLEDSISAQFLLAICLKQVGKTLESQKVFKNACVDLDQSSEFRPNDHSLILEVSRQVAPFDGHEGRDRIVVNSLKDEFQGIEDGQVSLREAIYLVRDGGTIEVDIEGTIELKIGNINIDKSVSIVGPGADKLTISGEDVSRIFIVDDGIADQASNVVISGLKMEHGLAGREPSTTLLGRRFYGGGAIFSTESLTLTDSHFEQNNSRAVGSVIHSSCDERFVIRRCVFLNNNTNYSGAVYVHSPMAVAEITNSTFSHNTGGAIRLICLNAKVDHCTIADNIGGTGAISYGQHRERDAGDPKLTLANCIVTGNTDSDGKPADITILSKIGATVSHSIFGTIEGDFNDDGTNLRGVDPKLGPLADNGGSTKTRALLEGSPAIDAAGKTELEFDQRGEPFKRVIDGDGINGPAPDIGAFELQK